MQFNNNNGYHGYWFVSILCFSPVASKASCVLNNDRDSPAATAACFPSPPKHKMTANHFPPPLTHKMPCLFLWLDQSFDLCCRATFPYPACASRVRTLAQAPGNTLTLMLSTAVTEPLSVWCHLRHRPLRWSTGEIWHPCWAVNNRIYLPVFNHHCHLCSQWWNVPMLIFGCDVFFISVPGYKARCWWPAMGKSCWGGLAGSAQGTQGAQSCLRWRDKDGWQGTAGEAEDSAETQWTTVNSERHQVIINVCYFLICSATKPSLDSLQFCFWYVCEHFSVNTNSFICSMFFLSTPTVHVILLMFMIFISCNDVVLTPQ